MAYFEHTYNGSVAKFGTNKPDVYMYMRIHGNTYPDARYLEYYVTLGCYYAYRSAWTWKETNFVVGGVDHLNGADLAYNAGGGATDLKTVGPFRVDYGLDGNAGSVQLWGRLYNSSVLNKNTGKRYSLDTRLDSVWYPFPWIAAATKPSVPGNQRLNGSTSLTVTERSQNFTLSWNKPSGGTYGVAGYRLYWSKGDGWQHFATVENANQLSHTFNINTIYSSMPRGNSIGFQVQAYNSRQDSGHAPGMFDYNKLTLAKMSFNSISTSEVSFYSARIHWSSNLNVKTVQYSFDNANWRNGQTNLNNSSGNFTISGLANGTKYTVYIRLFAYSDGTVVSRSTSFTTASMSTNAWVSATSFYSTTINWSSNVNIKTIEYNINNGGWATYQSGQNKTSGDISIGSLTSSTNYTIQVRLTAVGDNRQKTHTLTTTTSAMSISLSTSSTSFYSTTVNWSSNVNIKTVEYNINNGGWSSKQSVSNVKSGNFGLSGLTSGTSYNIQVRLTGASDGKTITSNISFSTRATDVKVTTSNITPVGVKINWNSSVNIKTVQWKLSTDPDSAYKNAKTGLNQSSGDFTITSLTFNKSYTINVRVTGYTDSKTATTSTTIKTLDIARLTAVTKSWDVDKSAEVTATNPGNCALQLYIDYYANNTWVALISRAPITLTNGKYGITLNTSEINMLYKRASGDTNAKFRFTLKSLYPNYLGEHSMETKITFPTKAWVRPDGTGEWKRALVWAKDSAGTWKQVSPWVDPANNKNWKKI